MSWQGMKKPKSSMMVQQNNNRPSPNEKSDSSAVSTPTKKVSISEKAVQDKLLKPLSRTFLSKSHDNLASTLRRRANSAGQPRPQSTLGIPKQYDDKRPMSAGHKDKSPGRQGKFKVPNSTPIRKASSVQSIDRASTLKSQSSPIKKANSIQNINKTSVAAPRRVASSQTINRDKNSRINRISAPANAMAYNAELLANFEKERRNMEGRISELIQVAESRKADIEKYKIEVRQLKEKVHNTSSISEELNVLHHENKLLKDRLHELGIPVEQITDTEKLSLLQNKRLNEVDGDGEMQGAIGGKSFEGDNRSDDALGDGDVSSFPGDYKCDTPDHPSCFSLDNGQWERQSNKSSDALSEVSVACLQDRIVQMEETHYSTSEELQATLQELGDLQDTVNELTNDNERLADEKAMLLETLCTQTEKLEKCRTQIEHLKALLLSDMGNGDRSDRECQLVELLKSAQEEREELMLKQQELSNALQTSDNEYKEIQDVVTALKDKTTLMEDKNDVISAEKKALEYKLSEHITRLDSSEIEISRLKKSLSNEKVKILELEQARKAEDKSDLDELLDRMRLDKEKVETQLADVQERFEFKDRETTKLKEQLSKLERELAVSQADQNGEIEDCLTKIDKLNADKLELRQQLESLRDHIDQLVTDNDRYLEEKKSFGSTLSDLQAELKESKQRIVDYEEEMKEMVIRHKDEMQEWKQFQMDLQTAVVIANDIKTETQEDMERIKEDSASYQEINKQFKVELEKLQNELDRVKLQAAKNNSLSAAELQKRMMPNVDRELAILRQGKKPSDGRLTTRDKEENRDVKAIIRSIEDQVKGGTTSKSSSTSSSRRSSLDSIKEQQIKSPPPELASSRWTSTPTESQIKTGILRKTADSAKDKHPMRHSVTSTIYEDHQPPVTDDLKLSPSRCETDGVKALSILSSKSAGRRNSLCEQEKKDPLLALVKQTGGSKRNALLKWCQHKTSSYPGIDITNFSSSWNDGLAFCAILHSYMPDKIPYYELSTQDKRRNFTLAFRAAESVGISSNLNMNEMAATERPDWMAVMSYVTSVYKHFEVDCR